MADGFVAWKAKGAENIARGADDAFLRGGGQEGSGNVGSPYQFTRVRIEAAADSRRHIPERMTGIAEREFALNFLMAGYSPPLAMS